MARSIVSAMPAVTHRTVPVGDLDVHVATAGDGDTAVLLLHGFPELAYSWRHQLPAVAAAGFRVVRFEFPYMAQRRQTGKQRPPDREPVLRATWLAVIEQLGAKNLIIGGKSMGGRIASLVAEGFSAIFSSSWCA